MALVPMTEQDMSELLTKDIFELEQKLIWENASILGENGRPDIELMTPTEALFHVALALDGEVNNGGFKQFLFNRGEQLEAVESALPLLNWPELESKLGEVLDSLTEEKVTALISARDRHDVIEAYIDWAQFYGDDEAFNRWYFAQGTALTDKLATALWARRDELIVNGEAN